MIGFYLLWLVGGLRRFSSQFEITFTCFHYLIAGIFKQNYSSGHNDDERS